MTVKGLVTIAEDLSAIVEVKRVTSEYGANRLLRGGWKLLSVASQQSFGARHNVHPGVEGTEAVYVVGRPKHVTYY